MALTKEQERKLAKLAALEAGGVDNWEWYGESLKEYDETIGREEAAEEIIDDILEAIHDHIEQPAGMGCGYGINPEGYDIAVKILLKRYNELVGME
jgi:hypothetical protein